MKIGAGLPAQGARLMAQPSFDISLSTLQESAPYSVTLVTIWQSGARKFHLAGHFAPVKGDRHSH
jgi:hypothetical protein